MLEVNRQYRLIVIFLIVAILSGVSSCRKNDPFTNDKLPFLYIDFLEGYSGEKIIQAYVLHEGDQPIVGYGFVDSENQDTLRLQLPFDKAKFYIPVNQNNSKYRIIRGFIEMDHQIVLSKELGGSGLEFDGL